MCSRKPQICDFDRICFQLSGAGRRGRCIEPGRKLKLGETCLLVNCSWMWHEGLLRCSLRFWGVRRTSNAARWRRHGWWSQSLNLHWAWLYCHWVSWPPKQAGWSHSNRNWDGGCCNCRLVEPKYKQQLAFCSVSLFMLFFLKSNK